MPLFRKRPIIIRAEQFHANVDKSQWPCGVYEDHTYFVDTLEGRMNVKDGDWIITGVHGERYPCDDVIFKKTYEEVTEESGTFQC